MTDRAAPLPPTPYKGLIPYTEEDAPFFFGRDVEREVITANLRASRLTLLYGASGVGKSSVLRAGVVHHLRRLARENLAEVGQPELVVVVFAAWRDDPLATLAARIQEAVAEALGVPALPPVAPGAPFVESLEAWAARVGGEVLVVLDQFEEYFLYHPGEDGEGTFAVEFPRAVNRPGLRVNFLISMREDSLAKLDRFKWAIPSLFDNYFRIEHLDRTAARAAIEKPIEQYNRLRDVGGLPIRIEPALVDAVLAQVRTGQVVIGESGRGAVGSSGPTVEARIETPFLQLVMTRLWEEEMGAESLVLRLETLTRLGGAEAIVRTHLHDAMEALPAAEQDAAASVFHHLVTPSGTKIAHAAADLAAYAGVSEAELEPVLDRLSGMGRILRVVEPPPGQTATRYEIFHDVLAAGVLEWRAEHVQQQQRADVARRAESEQRQRRLEAEARSVRYLRWLIGAAFLAILALGAFFYKAVQERHVSDQRAQEAVKARETETELRIEADTKKQEAERQKTEAERQQSLAESLAKDAKEQRDRAERAARTARVYELTTLALGNLETDPELSVLLALEAVSATRRIDGTITLAAFDALNRAVQTYRLRRRMDLSPTAGAPHAVHLSRDQITTLSRVRVWDRAASKEHEGPRLPFTATGLPALSEGGKYYAAIVDGVPTVWQAGGGATHLYKLPRVQLTLPRVQLTRVSPIPLVVSPDGERLLLVTGPNVSLLGRPPHPPVVPLEIPTPHQASVGAFSPDGSLVAVGTTNGLVGIWDGSGQARAKLSTGTSDAVRGVAISRDGKRVVTVLQKGAVVVFDLADGEPTPRRLTSGNGVNSVAFSPDGQRLVTAGSRSSKARGQSRDEDDSNDRESGHATVLDVQSGRELMALPGLRAKIVAAAFDPDGSRLVTVDKKNAYIWDVGAGQELLVIAGPWTEIVGIAFSPDGAQLATANQDGTARIWDAITGRELRAVRHDGQVIELAYSRDGTQLATCGRDGRVIVSDAVSGEVHHRFTRHERDVYDVAFSPDGRLVASASFDKKVMIWDARTGNVQLTLNHDARVLSVAFNRDGTRLASASRDKKARLWKLPSGDPVAVLQGHTDEVWKLEFSPDGTRLATVSFDGTLRIWDGQTGAFRNFIPAHAKKIWGVAFSRDGKLLATASSDQTAKVWDARSGLELWRFTGHTAPVNRVAFSPDGKRLATSSEDGTARVYALDVDHLITLAKQRLGERRLTTKECQSYLHTPTCPSTP